MGFVKEFKEFAFKGNVLDLAVGVIIGAAFGKIVTSLVEDVVTPLLLNPALKAAGAENISKLTWNGVAYGNFLSAVISFLCIAMVLFWIIKGANKISKKDAPAPAGPTDDQKLLTEIRDLLKSRNNI
nr:large conductance mechanosensitive channel protein MscL [uncultured Chryseobacterium sp.]